MPLFPKHNGIIHVKIMFITIFRISNNLMDEIWAKLSAFYCPQCFRQQVTCCLRPSNQPTTQPIIKKIINLGKIIDVLSSAAYPNSYQNHA